MKRLLAAGSGPIYQICKAFRDGEAGRAHNPEFTLLEWYRPGFDHYALMDEVQTLVTDSLGGMFDIAKSKRMSYQDAFLRHSGLDPRRAPLAALRDLARHHGLNEAEGPAGDDRDGWLDLLLSHVVAPKLGRGSLCFIYDYPASQAALARTRDCPDKGYAVAERFELFVNGLELASGYHELADAGEQRHRFEADNVKRSASNLPPVPLDEHLLAALEKDLPDCSGVALGIDRLLMLAVGAKTLTEVLSFPIGNA